ncbi:MAG: S8 family serine peptidase [Bdellovibrionales bacterium]|nr:S8 family serine peptidase [Bdellovibrionales bacterium]
MRALLTLAAAVAFAGVSACGASLAEAAGPKRPAPPRPESRRVVELEGTGPLPIALPDGDTRDYGAALEARLVTVLTESGRFRVVGAADPGARAATARLATRTGDEWVWPSSAEPAATIRIRVHALSLRTGDRGGRMMYGFDERQPLRDWLAVAEHLGAPLDEFALSSTQSEPEGFGGRFRPEGFAPFDTHSGLDLGDGFEINVLFAWLGLKYARYDARLALTVEITPASAPWAPQKADRRIVEVSARGFFFDVAGGYLGYSGGIALARRDALTRAFAAALTEASRAVDRMASPLRLTARLDRITGGGTVYLLGSGIDSTVRAGTRYRAVDRPDLCLEVVTSHRSGAEARLLEGSPFAAQEGQLFLEWRASDTLPGATLAARAAVVRAPAALPAGDAPTSSESARVSETNFPEPALPEGAAPRVSPLEAFLRSLLEAALLPYRIWRYFQTDRGFDDAFFAQPVHTPGNEPGKGPLVAVIDSGVDLRHRAFRGRLWRNSAAIRDGRGELDVGGWDFISGDARPYDDHGHGSAVAGHFLAHSAAFNADAHPTLLPLKVLNPWGVSSSTAMLAAFDAAIGHGTDVILCAWSTSIPSEALREGIRRAERAGIPVFTVDETAGTATRYPAAWAAEFSNLHVSHPIPLLPEARGPEPRGGWRRWRSADLLAAEAAAEWLQSR